jgi:hypothetical protein
VVDLEKREIKSVVEGVYIRNGGGVRGVDCCLKE